jgi:hypothetical protein
MSIQEGRIIGAPDSWQGDPLRCVDCGELVGPKQRVVVIQRTKTSKSGKEEIESEERITVPSFGCRCNRRPVVAKQEAASPDLEVTH